MLRPGDDWGDIWRSVAGAFDQGYDAIRLHNYTMFPDLGPQINWMIRDPNQLRSPFAAFDPAKRGSSDLLAGFVAPIGPVPPGFNLQPEQSDPQMAARAAWLQRRNEAMAPAPGLASWRPPAPEPKSEPVRMMRLPTGQLVDEATVPNSFRPLHRQIY